MTTTGTHALDARCDACGAALTIGAAQRTERCPFCDAPSVVTHPASPGRSQPTFAIGFSLERDDAVRAVAHWLREQRATRFGPTPGVVERVTGVYLPAYLYSSTALSEYQASIGETYRTLGIERDDDGGASIGRKEKTEYRDLAGRRMAYVADILVSASRGLPNPEIDAIEPFDLGRVRRYVPALVAGWTSEEPTLTLDDCLQVARTEAHARVERELHRFMPGDEIRALRHQTRFVNETLDLVLVPVWVCAVRHHARKPPVRVLVNGQTGRVGGVIPFSWAQLGLVAAISVAAMIVVLMILRLLMSGVR